MKEKTAADKYLTVQSVAEMLACSPHYIYALVRDGKLQAVKIGKRALRISEQSLQAFIATRVVNSEDYFAPEKPPAPENVLIGKK